MPLRRRVVLDTNVVSYILDQEEEAQYYLAAIEGCELLISFQTLEELLHWGILKGWGPKRTGELNSLLEQYEVVYPTDTLVLTCARLRSDQLRLGKPLSTADAWIVATALTLDCPLASHDGSLADVPELQLIQSPEVGD